MNKTLKKNSSFTLIELLVVIVIIGILAGLVTIAATSFINNSHNARMVAELAGISKKLIGETEFPAGNFCMEDGSDEAKKLLDFLEMEKAPAHPLYNGGTHLTTNECFLYFSDGEHYSIRVPTVGNKGYLIQESRNPNPQGIQEKCEECWIPFGNRCVMQFEAAKNTTKHCKDENGADTALCCKDTSGNPMECPISVAGAWGYMTQPNAKAVCESIGAHLMTNTEWMALARDIEAQDENWTGGKVGNGILKRGNVNKTDAGSYGDGNKDDGILINEKARLKFSNGHTIYHFSGNMWEWIDYTIAKENLPNTSSWVEFSKASFNVDYLPVAEVVPLEASSALGGGKMYYGNRNEDLRAILRGGYWNESDKDATGIFALYLNNEPQASYSPLGFRCVR